MTDEREKKLADLQQRHAEHPGTLASRRWRELKRSGVIYQLNARDLVEHLAGPEEDPAQMAMLMEDRSPPSTYQYDYWERTDQRLANLASSVYLLIEHTRRLLQHYPESEFAAEHADRNRHVAEADVSAFLVSLRHYLVHCGVAPIQHTMSFGMNGVSFQVNLSASELLGRHKSWSSGAKNYLRSRPDGRVHLREAVEEYIELMDQYHGWLFDQFNVMHSADVEAADQLAEEAWAIRTGQSA